MVVVQPGDETAQQAPPAATAVPSAFDLLLAGGAAVTAAQSAAPSGSSSVGPASPSATEPPADTGAHALALHIEPQNAPGPRATSLEWIALVAAVVVAPIGLILGIIASRSSASSRGYVSTLARSAIVVAIVFLLVDAAAITVGAIAANRAAHEESLRVSSQPMCTQLAERPGVLADPAFGWPALVSIPTYTADVSAYETWWKKLASVAPAGVRKDATAVATAATAVSGRITISRIIDHARDYSEIEAVARTSGLPAWASTYCK
ncbi:hypothetical protein BH09ACT6_BH09ACT6_18240 [soil metagenome]